MHGRFKAIVDAFHFWRSANSEPEQHRRLSIEEPESVDSTGILNIVNQDQISVLAGCENMTASITNELHHAELQAELDELKKKDVPRGFSILLAQIAIGMSRDLMWGITAYKQQDLFAGKLGAFIGPTFTQMCTSALPILGGLKLTNAAYNGLFVDNKSAWLKKQFAFAVSSWTAIPFWNGAQYLGSWLAEKTGMSATGASYASGIFAGAAETIWQGAIILPLLLSQPADAIEVALNFLGGAVWQWIYQANLPNTNTNSENHTHDAFVGLQIAAGVAASTLLMTLIAWQINKHRHSAPTTQEESAVDLENSVRSNRTTYGTFGKYSPTMFATETEKAVLIESITRDMLPQETGTPSIDIS